MKLNINLKTKNCKKQYYKELKSKLKIQPKNINITIV